MPRKMTSAEAQRMARARWNRHHEAVAAGAAEAWADDALSLAVLPKSELDGLLRAALRQGAEGAVREVAPSVAVAAAELGLDRAAAERAADLIVLFVADAIRAAGGPEISLPAPEAWRATVAWDALYGPEGRSLVAGAIARESAAEMAEAGGD